MHTNAPYFRNRPYPYNHLTNSEDVSVLKGFSLLFSENVAPCTPPENKDFTIISHLSQVLPESIGKLHQLQHLDVSHNCLMTLPKVMDRCLKAAKPPGFDGLWSSCLYFGLGAQISRTSNLGQMLVRIDTYTAYHSIPATSLCQLIFLHFQNAKKNTW